jgi:outer membrane protein OmpA-like peptidoglycan-associated protein
MKRLTSVLIAISSAAVLIVGCSGSAEIGTSEPPPPVESAGEEVAVEEPAGPVDPDDVHLEGDHITIDEHILFALNSDEILPASATILDHLAEFLKNHAADVPGLRVIGHTDRQGGAKHNQKLSERRAAAVAAALQERGVPQRLESEGKGNTQKLCTEDTDECHERNRRVELLIIQ